MNRLKLVKELEMEWTDCNKCPLSNLRKRIVFGSGNPNAKLFILGEAPGEDEDDGGEPFIGRAGKVLNWLLDGVGISREELWITNVCLCRPKSNIPGKNNRAPKSKEIAACKPRLLKEINIIKPEIIVLAGNTPLLFATGRRGITKNRGWQKTIWSSNNYTTDKVFATLHPASLLYGSKEQKLKKAEWLKADWSEIAREFLGKKSKREKI